MQKTNFNILVVEDDPNDQLFIESAFRKIGCGGAIRLVSDGAEAIAYLTGEGKFADRNAFPYPSLVITDLKMRMVDGFAVLEHIQRHPAWTMIPRVVLTASRDPDDIKRSYILGASSYHVKPSTPEGLRHLLKQLCDYWHLCEVPEVDQAGKQLETSSVGKLGERFSW